MAIASGETTSTSTPWSHNYTLVQVSGGFTVLEGLCGTDETGNCVHSPHYPKFYDDGECLIEVQAGIVHAVSFETEVMFDRLVFNSGEYSGTDGPENVHVGDGDRILWATHDNTIKHAGWELCWSNNTAFAAAEPQCPDIHDFIYNRRERPSENITEFDVVSGTCTVSDSGLCVRSPNYPGEYNNNDCCTIHSPGGYLVSNSFAVESWWDHLYIVNSDHYGYAALPVIEVTAGDNIAWSSDESVVNSGWEICVGDRPTTTTRTPVEEITTLISGCNVTGNCVSSPHYPAHYENNEVCKFLVPSGFLFAMNFETEEHFDYMYIGEDKYHGTWGPWGLEVASGEEIVWESDYSIVKDGWVLCVQPENFAPSTTSVAPVTALTVLSGDCMMTSSTCVASPNYPGEYENDESCTIASPPGFISSTSFDTERFYDFLYVGGLMFHGSDNLVGVEVANDAHIEWETDFSIVGGGWEICYNETVPVVSSEPITTLTVLSGDCYKTSESCVASPNFPSLYGPGQSCTIESPAGWISSTSFDTEEYFDYLAIGFWWYDGTYGPVWESVKRPLVDVKITILCGFGWGCGSGCDVLPIGVRKPVLGSLLLTKAL